MEFRTITIWPPFFQYNCNFYVHPSLRFWIIIHMRRVRHNYPRGQQWWSKTWDTRPWGILFMIWFTEAVCVCNFKVNWVRLQDSFSDFTTPQDWKMILDKPNCISFIWNWAFDNNRASIELAVLQTNNTIYLTVRAHGNETILSDFDSSSLSSSASSISNGVSLPHGENLEALAPHIKGSCKDLTADAD